MSTITELQWFPKTIACGGVGEIPQSGWFTAARWLLGAVLMAAPLAFGAVEAWAWSTLTIAAGTVLVLWALGCASSGVIRLAWSPIYLLAAAALGLVVWQWATGSTADPMGTREALIKFSGYAVLFFLTGQLFSTLSPRCWSTIGITVTIYTFAMAVFAIMQFFSSPGLVYWTIRPRWGGYIFGPYINHNHYAGLLELVLPLAIGTVIELPARHGFKAFGTFAAAVGIASVLLSGSRGGSIAVMLELAIFLVLLVRRSELGRHRAAGVAVLGLGILLLAVFAWLDTGAVWQRWQKIAETPEITTEGRQAIARDALGIWRERPLAGFGAGTFEFVYPPHQSWKASGVIDHAHNDYAELLAETGVVGGLILLAFLGLLLRCGFGYLKHLVIGDTWMRVGAAIGCCGLLLHSFADFNLHIPANAAWFAVAAGLATCFFHGELVV